MQLAQSDYQRHVQNIKGWRISRQLALDFTIDVVEQFVSRRLGQQFGKACVNFCIEIERIEVFIGGKDRLTKGINSCNVTC